MNSKTCLKFTFHFHIRYNNIVSPARLSFSERKEICKEILSSKKVELLPLLNAAYEVRKENCGKEVLIHIINNGLLFIK